MATGFIKAIKDGGMLELRSLLCIGGVDVRLQCDEIRKGIHISVSTPGRLKVGGYHSIILVLFVWSRFVPMLQRVHDGHSSLVLLNELTAADKVMQVF